MCPNKDNLLQCNTPNAAISLPTAGTDLIGDEAEMKL
jgi:hypothetical protein